MTKPCGSFMAKGRVLGLAVSGTVSRLTGLIACRIGANSVRRTGSRRLEPILNLFGDRQQKGRGRLKVDPFSPLLLERIS